MVDGGWRVGRIHRWTGNRVNNRDVLVARVTYDRGRGKGAATGASAHVRPAQVPVVPVVWQSDHCEHELSEGPSGDDEALQVRRRVGVRHEDQVGDDQ